MKYVEDCKMRFSQGEECEYIRCVLGKARQMSLRNPRGSDKDVVHRATEALVRLQVRYPKGVSGEQIFAAAGFTTYHNTNSHGLWPWLEGFGGLTVVRKLPGTKYLITDRFYECLQQYYSN